MGRKARAADRGEGGEKGKDGVALEAEQAGLGNVEV